MNAVGAGGPRSAPYHVCISVAMGLAVGIVMHRLADRETRPMLGVKPTCVPIGTEVEVGAGVQTVPYRARRVWGSRFPQPLSCYRGSHPCACLQNETRGELMPRPRKPTAILERTGAFLRHPERKRARANEPAPSGPLGDPPARLSDVEAAAWQELADQLPSGVAKRSDRAMFELISRLTARQWQGNLTLNGMRILASLLGKFGVGPSERSKVTATPDEDSDASEGLEYLERGNECIN
jgi:hypothetical protein